MAESRVLLHRLGDRDIVSDHPGAVGVAFTRIDDLAAASGGDPAALPAVLTEGYSDAFVVGSGLGLVGLIATLVLIRGRDSRAHVKLGGAEGAAPVGAS